MIDVVSRYVTPAVSRRAGLEGGEETGPVGRLAEPLAGTPYPFVMQRWSKTWRKATGPAGEWRTNRDERCSWPGSLVMRGR